MNIIFRPPSILEARARREAIRGGMKITILVERRISGYEVNSAAVDASQEWEIIPVKQRPI